MCVTQGNVWPPELLNVYNEAFMKELIFLIGFIVAGNISEHKICSLHIINRNQSKTCEKYTECSERNGEQRTEQQLQEHRMHIC